jgi:hypothetical protein
MSDEGESSEVASDEEEAAFALPDSDTDENATDTQDEESDELDDDGSDQDSDDDQDSADSSESETPTTDKSQNYDELQRFVGRQSSEIGELRRELAEFKATQTREDEASKPNPFEQDDLLRTMDDNQLDLLRRSGSASFRSELAQLGLTPEDLKEVASFMQQQNTRNVDADVQSEQRELITKFGEDNVVAAGPEMARLFKAQPARFSTYEDLYYAATYEDLQKGQKARVEANTQERKARARSADSGKTGPRREEKTGLSRKDVDEMSKKDYFSHLMKQQK